MTARSPFLSTSPSGQSFQRLEGPCGPASVGFSTVDQTFHVEQLSTNHQRKHLAEGDIGMHEPLMPPVTTLTPKAAHRAQLEPLCNLLLHWNSAHNLVSRKMSPDDVLDLLWEATVFERFLPQGAHIADLGSGAGIPALPLAVIRPDLTIEAVEPRAKRCTWLRFASTQLSCPMTVTESRWDASWQHVDYVVSRAVFPPDQFCAAVGLLATKSLQMTGDTDLGDGRVAYALAHGGKRVGLVLAGDSVDLLDKG